MPAGPTGHTADEARRCARRARSHAGRPPRLRADQPVRRKYRHQPASPLALRARLMPVLLPERSLPMPAAAPAHRPTAPCLREPPLAPPTPADSANLPGCRQRTRRQRRCRSRRRQPPLRLRQGRGGASTPVRRGPTQDQHSGPTALPPPESSAAEYLRLRSRGRAQRRRLCRCATAGYFARSFKNAIKSARSCGLLTL